MKIYIASSFRNRAAVELLRDALTAKGHYVLDWTPLAPPLPAGMPVAERRKALDTDERGEVFRFCSGACGGADLLIYYGPAGQDAACEVGMAHVSGVPVFALLGPLDEPGLMLHGCFDRVCESTQTLFALVDEMSPFTAVRQ